MSGLPVRSPREDHTMADGRAQRIGMIGTGRMGGPMAERLLGAGHALVVFDANAAAIQPLAARGATVASSAVDVANQAEVVLASLPTPDIVRQVIIRPGGVLEGSRIRYFVDLSSTGAVATTEIAATL